MRENFDHENCFQQKFFTPGPLINVAFISCCQKKPDELSVLSPALGDWGVGTISVIIFVWSQNIRTTILTFTSSYCFLLIFISYLGGGAHLREVWVGVCCQGLQTLILFKTKLFISLPCV